MNHFQLMAAAILSSMAFAPASAMAQATVTDPAASVPPIVYQSVFNQSPTGVETKSVDWKKANAEVGQFKRGHVDILKWEESQLKDKPVGKAATQSEAAPATPAPSPASAVPASTAAPAAPTPHKH